MRALILDGPHRGAVEVVYAPPTLGLYTAPTAAPPDTSAAAPAFTLHEYERLPPAPGDFAKGYAARYRWTGR